MTERIGRWLVGFNPQIPCLHDRSQTNKTNRMNLSYWWCWSDTFLKRFRNVSVQIIDIFETIFDIYFLKFSLTYYYFLVNFQMIYCNAYFRFRPLKNKSGIFSLCNSRICEVCSKILTESESSMRHSIIFWLWSIDYLDHSIWS